MPGRIFSLLPRPPGRSLHISPPLSQTLIYKSCTLVEQSQKSDMFYLASCLHYRRHGSGMLDPPSFLQALNKLESMSIPVDRLPLHTDPTITNLAPPQRMVSSCLDHSASSSMTFTFHFRKEAIAHFSTPWPATSSKMNLERIPRHCFEPSSHI